MPAQFETPNRNEVFGRLLSGAINSIATYEGRTAPIIEEELGQLIGIAGKTIQRYKAGHLPPEDRTVEILATAAIQRAYLGRDWLQRFLHAARYPFANTLLDRLCPIGPARPRPPRVYENLPAPTYSQFVMRQLAFDEVIDGLQQRSAMVLIVGLGGNGKTSLARELAARCLQDNGDAPQFDAVVWVSDKDRPGTTNLSVVLDEIARTLDYPGFTQFEHDEKRREVENLLRRQRVLVVIDNFETISDSALLAWLLRLPEPSKAIVTSREYGRAFRRNCWPVELRGMREDEAQEFIGQRLRVLRIEKLVSDQAQLEPLVVATGSNPKAIEIALGLIKHERRPLQQVVDGLYAARGELFDDLFTRAWALLDEATRHVLLVMTFFPDSASGAALSATADVHGFDFDHAVERLTDLALLDTHQEDLNSPSRYTLHPLVRAFAGARLEEQVEFEKGARERWVEWYIWSVSKVGVCWDDLSKLDMLDSEQETAFSAICWTSKTHHYVETIQLAKGIDYYYYIRGFWAKRLTIELQRAEAAHNLSEPAEEAEALAYYVQLLTKQGNLDEVAKYLPRLYEITKSVHLAEDIFYELQHAIALYWMGRNNLDAAQEAWQISLERAEKLSSQRFVGALRWLATCFYQKGLCVEAQQLFQKSLQASIQFGFQRSIIFSQLGLVRVDLDQEKFEGVEALLEEGSTKAQQYQDRWALAEIRRTYARLHILRGDLPAARAALTEAIDLFERLGMRRELAEARDALADLDVREPLNR
jgi:LuxR family glucitol operon transcriptional activator